MEAEEEQMRVRRRTLQAVLEQCRAALELLQDAELGRDPTGDADMEKVEEVPEEDDAGDPSNPASPSAADFETDQLCDLLKSRVESPDFLQKLGNSKISVPHSISADDSASWDFVTAIEFGEDEHVNGDNESEQDDYVLVRQEDIVDGIASFMAAYLLSLKQTKHFAKHFLSKRRKVNFVRPGMEAKLFTMLHPGVQLLLAYTKIQCY
ncbi:hypothetical protein MUK42_12650 [Musa troglodytarum]|uniref:Uncharacterized protein n=1 Tax=Musa troglodytarum TaxID=320322 RepID=A0A9E7GFZ7_9LILI|nr:hypothetical protein MUK42_12650 [Musa troglodytarum]